MRVKYIVFSPFDQFPMNLYRFDIRKNLHEQVYIIAIIAIINKNCNKNFNNIISNYQIGLLNCVKRLGSLFFFSFNFKPVL